MSAPEQLTLDQISTELRLAELWREKNPDAYDRIIEWATEDAELRGYCSMQAYLEALRSPALARRLGLTRSDEVYKVNHNLRAALTRMVLAEHPELPFRPRKSDCDRARGTFATPEVMPRP